jgi:thioredoxin 1
MYLKDILLRLERGETKMNEESKESSIGPVQYELIISEQDALTGVQKILSRNGKRLQVSIPAGVITGSTVKLSNALQLTDNRAGDILLKITVKSELQGQESVEKAGVVEINDNNFDSEVLKDALPVVVDFWAPWCGPCRMMAPIMEKAAAQYKGRFKFCKINVDENPKMASQYQAMSIPLLLFFKGGQVIDKSLGAIPEAQLLAKLDSLL